MFNYNLVRSFLNLRNFSYLLISLIFSLSAFAQDEENEIGGNIEDRLAPEYITDFSVKNPNEDKNTVYEIPLWRDLTPREYTSMLFTIMMATEVLSELSDLDSNLLNIAKGNIPTVDGISRARMDRLCLQVLAGEYTGIQGAYDLAPELALVDRPPVSG